MANGMAVVLVDPNTDAPYAAGAVRLVTANGAKANGLATSVGLATTPLLNANANRRRVLIQNQDAANPIFVQLNGAAVAGAGAMRIAAGAMLELTGSSESLAAIATGAPVAVTVWEF